MEKKHYLANGTEQRFTEYGRFAPIYKEKLTHQIGLRLTEKEYNWAIANKDAIRLFIQTNTKETS